MQKFSSSFPQTLQKRDKVAQNDTKSLKSFAVMKEIRYLRTRKFLRCEVIFLAWIRLNESFAIYELYEIRDELIQKICYTIKSQ